MAQFFPHHPEITGTDCFTQNQLYQQLNGEITLRVTLYKMQNTKLNFPFNWLTFRKLDVTLGIYKERIFFHVLYIFTCIHVSTMVGNTGFHSCFSNCPGQWCQRSTRMAAILEAGLGTVQDSVGSRMAWLEEHIFTCTGMTYLVIP